MRSEADHFWRESEGICLGCGLDLEAMLADIREHGYPTCDRSLQEEAMASCKICRRLLNEGDEVIRVEKFMVSSRGTEGTTGWSSTDARFVHLHHLKHAYLAILKDPGKGKW